MDVLTKETKDWRHKWIHWAMGFCARAVVVEQLVEVVASNTKYQDFESSLEKNWFEKKEIKKKRQERRVNLKMFVHNKPKFFNNFILGFGLGTMIYNGLELGTFFEIPWNSPCYQVLRGINPILQMVFTFSQMYFVFMNARVRFHHPKDSTKAQCNKLTQLLVLE